MLLGLIKPTKGMAYLFGKKIAAGHIDWNSVGYLVEAPSAYLNLTVRENLEVAKKYRHLTGKRKIESSIDQLGLRPYENVKAEALSMGNFQRLGLAKAMFHEPKLLILSRTTENP